MKEYTEKEYKDLMARISNRVMDDLIEQWNTVDLQYDLCMGQATYMIDDKKIQKIVMEEENNERN